jgi:hypothetical protein
MADPDQSTKSENNNWEEKKLAALLEAASIAIKRARYVFIIINIGAILIFSAEFNALLPWMRWPMQRTSTPEETKQILRTVFHGDLEIVSVPLLGIKFSVADLTVIGSIAMLILAIWFFYCVRRENLVVDDINRMAFKTSNAHKRAYLYYGIAHYFVYTTVTLRERPAGLSSQGPESTARHVVKFLFYVPCLSPLLIVFSDIVSLIMSPKAAPNSACQTLWCAFSPWEMGEAIGRMAFGVFMGIVIWSLCTKAYKWDAGTRNLVESLRKKVEREEN